MSWKKLILIVSVLTVLFLLAAALFYIPKYLAEEQRMRDNSPSCSKYRDFLETAQKWNELGDGVQANGVYGLALDLYIKGKCTKIH